MPYSTPTTRHGEGADTAAPAHAHPPSTPREETPDRETDPDHTRGPRETGTRTGSQTETPDGREDRPEGPDLRIADRVVVGGVLNSPVRPSKAETRGTNGLREWSEFRVQSGGGPLHRPRKGRSPVSKRGLEAAAKKGRPKKWLSRYTCSEAFREYVAARYPGLDLDPAYWLFMELLLFARDRHAGNTTGMGAGILIPHERIARICGCDPHHGGFRSGDFLEAFQRDVLPGFVWNDFNHDEGRVRSVADDGLHPTVLEALAIEMHRRPHEILDRVYFASGFKYNKRKDAAELRDNDATMIEIPPTDDQRFIQEYLHGLDVRRFAFLEDTFDDAYAASLALKNDNVRLQALKMLRTIYIQPVPFYNPVGNSYRLFSTMGGLQQINREVRKVLMRGCWDLDADALHLAIMARAWEIPKLQAFLEAHGAAAVWRSLTAHVAYVLHGRDPNGIVRPSGSDPSGPLDDEEHKAYKAAIKHGVYALGYGGGKATIAEQIRSYDDDRLFAGPDGPDYDEVVEVLMSHELLGLVFEAKSRMLERIKDEKGMRGVYGWVPMKKGRNPLTVLAMVSSSYEMALMRTAFDVAAEHEKSGSLLLYQYDGVTLSMRRQADTDWLIAKMQEAFDAKARELGIATQLSAEYLD